MALKYLYAPSGYKGGTSSGTAYGVLPNDSTADFDEFQRLSFATRTNKDGLLETSRFVSDDLVINGNFATDSNWDKSDSSVTISSGKARFNNTPDAQALTQNNRLTTGKSYEITFTVSDYVKGALKVRFPFISSSVNSNGVHVITGVSVSSSGGSDDLRFQAVGETTLSIDNVSVKETELNIPRIDYSDGGCPSLLLEEQKTNICKYSEQITAWGKNPSDGTVLFRANEEASPDGDITADVVSVSTQYDGVYTHGITTVAESTYSCSTYVRHVSGSSKIIFGVTKYFYSTSETSSTRSLVIDLSNGSIISNEVSSFATAKVINAGNGWYRVIIENMTIPVGGGGNSHFVVYSYENAFTEFSVWGGQIEVGEYASSYIPNLSNSQTTRNDDKANFAGNFDFNSFEGVLEARFKAVPMSIPSSRITLAADVNNTIVLGYLGGDNDPVPYLLITSPLSADEDARVIMPSSFNLFDYNTYKLKFQSGNNELKINGELVDTDNNFKTHTFAFGSALRTISLNSFGTSTSRLFYGGIKHIKVYDSITDF